MPQGVGVQVLFPAPDDNLRVIFFFVGTMIRLEKYENYKKISEMVKESFACAEHSDGNEHILIQKLRKSYNYITKLSLVYEENDTILGFIMFTKAKVGEDIVLALAPLAVDINNLNKVLGQNWF